MSKSKPFLRRAPAPGRANAIRRFFGARPWPLELPVVVQFPVNDICDSKCQMCNIWQQKRDREISVDEARALFSNPLFRNVVALGLNGGEPTLRRDLAELGGMMLETLPRLRTLSLITNGLHAERAMERIGELSRTVRAHGGHLDVMVSLDGVGDVHDFVRGVPGNFENAVRVLDFAKALPGVSVRVGCTVISENAYHLHALLDFCKARGVYVKYRLGVPNRRLYNLPAPPPHRQIGKRAWLDTHPFAMDAAQRWHFAQFLLGVNRDYEPSLAQAQFYRSLVGQLVAGAPRRAGCDWQHRGVTVSSRGEILYCAVQSDVLGDGLTQDPQTLYFGNEAHLRRIFEEKCAGCAHDYVGPPGGRDEFELMADRWLRRTGSSLPSLRRTHSYRALLRAKRAIVAPLRMELHRRRLRRDEGATAPGSGREGTLLCGWYGTETLGDKAILASIVSRIRRLDPGGSIRIASLEPMYTRLTVAGMPDLTGCEVVDVATAMRTVASHKALLFAGGPLMAIPQMAEMESLFRRATHAGVPGILAGCGVGPLGSASANRAIRGVLESARQRMFRDAKSLEAARRLSRHDTASDAVCEDPAASWVAAVQRPLSVEANVPTLGLGLRDWPSHEYAPGMGPARADAVRARFEQALLSALEKLVAGQPALRILPVPFGAHDAGGDDRLLYWRLVGRASSALRAAFDASLISREPSPEEAIAAMNGCSAFLSMRFHSLVFADTLGLPVVAIDYTLGAGKTHSLARRLGCRMLRIDRVDEGPLEDALRQVLAEPRRPARDAFLFPAAFDRAWVAAGLGTATAAVPGSP